MSEYPNPPWRALGALYPEKEYPEEEIQGLTNLPQD
jgi:hypothetical protein